MFIKPNWLFIANFCFGVMGLWSIAILNAIING